MSKWSLNSKIYFIFGVLVSACIAISCIGLLKMNELKVSLNSIVNGSASRVGNAHELKELFFIQLINEKNYILEDHQEGMQLQQKRLVERDLEFKVKHKEAVGISTAAGQQDLKRLLDLYGSWWGVNEQIRGLANESKNAEAAKLSMTKGREVRLKVEELLNGTVGRNEEFMKKDVALADEAYIQARALVLFTSISSIIFGLSLGIYILKKSAKEICNVMATLAGSSEQVSTAAHQIANASEELSSAATEQAASLEQTSSSIEEMSSMVQKNAESAKRTSELANTSSQNAEKGKQVVENMILAIGDISASNHTIQNQIESSNNEIAEIVKVIAEIGNKTKVINDIVFQTKLLSFNASVEAARAGDNGKGFAVVAEEVGNLAQMSGNAAKEITEMLDSSIKKVEDIVNGTKLKIGHLIQDGKSKIDSGNQIAKQCGAVLDDIVSGATSVTQMADEIATACREQAIGVQEITKAMSQLDQVTQINAATSEESASAAEELSAQAESLEGSVGILVTTIKGCEVGKQFEDGKRKKKLAHTPNNVVPLKQKAKPQGVPHKRPAAYKKAVGFEVGGIPSENDSRFEDV